ncbi:hypothetical protein ACFVEN_25555 [Streptomyces sp. NPDC057681]|uniref:hypothetical protein n=1 Tax=Streptomyces sp. NPDC057681 TaxID=3346209 RepID=UPI0036C0F6B5
MGTPPISTYPPSRRRPHWLFTAVGIGLVLGIAAAAVWSEVGGRENSGDISAEVIDCSQTQLYMPEGGSAMVPARIAQIQFVNNGDDAETFSAQVDGVTLEGHGGNPSTFTLAPHDSKTISFSMNPTKYGNSEGACYNLNVGAAQ